ncbi:hypothetical protein [Nocardiopsis oceani]
MRDNWDLALAHRLADLAGDIAMRYAAEGTAGPQPAGGVVSARAAT